MGVGKGGQSRSPGNEQRDFWGSEAAGRNGSRNLVGIANPAIDALVEAMGFAPDRDSLVTACRALDRALLWREYAAALSASGVSAARGAGQAETPR